VACRAAVGEFELCAPELRGSVVRAPAIKIAAAKLTFRWPKRGLTCSGIAGTSLLAAPTSVAEEMLLVCSWTHSVTRADLPVASGDDEAALSWCFVALARLEAC
jgi:hypothetical protein